MAKSGFTKEQYLKWYESMLLWRRFEEKASQLYIQQKIRGFCHLYIGQEAVVAGAISVIRDDDNMISAYRDHVHPIAKGVHPNAIMAELMATMTQTTKTFRVRAEGLAALSKPLVAELVSPLGEIIELKMNSTTSDDYADTASIIVRQTIDWHNGRLPTQDGTRIDNRNVAVYWNWFVRTNRWAETKWVPPTLGTLRALGYTFNTQAPWYAAAGETRGYLPDCQRVQYDRVSEDTKQAMYGNGNSVNPILKIKGSHYLYGERTMQRAESKLTAVHNVIMINWVLSGMSTVARRYVFDPNDAELLIQLKLAFSEFLDRIVNGRGIEQYNLVMDDRNNTAETRNNREVVVDLEVIPTDVAEKIYINAIVRESGAVLNTLG